jgi:hypothetical protein
VVILWKSRHPKKPWSWPVQHPRIRDHSGPELGA